MCIVQGRNKVRWHLGQEISLPPLCSNLRSFGSKCTVLKKCLWHCWYFLVSRNDLAPGELCPLAPSLRLWCYAIKIGKFPKVNQFSSPNVMNICNFRTQYGTDLAQNANKGYWRHFRFLRVVLCHFYACPTHFSGWTCVLLITKVFGRLTSYFFKVR